MSKQEAMNRKVPLAPELREIACIPPIRIEAPISKPCNLSPDVHISMEEAEEHDQPTIGSRGAHLQGILHHLNIAAFSQWLY